MMHMTLTRADTETPPERLAEALTALHAEGAANQRERLLEDGFTQEALTIATTRGVRQVETIEARPLAEKIRTAASAIAGLFDKGVIHATIRHSGMSARETGENYAEIIAAAARIMADEPVQP